MRAPLLKPEERHSFFSLQCTTVTILMVCIVIVGSFIMHQTRNVETAVAGSCEGALCLKMNVGVCNKKPGDEDVCSPAGSTKTDCISGKKIVKTKYSDGNCQEKVGEVIFPMGCQEGDINYCDERFWYIDQKSCQSGEDNENGIENHRRKLKLTDLRYDTVDTVLRGKSDFDYWLYTEGTVDDKKVGLFTTRYPMADDTATRMDAKEDHDTFIRGIANKFPDVPSFLICGLHGGWAGATSANDLSSCIAFANRVKGMTVVDACDKDEGGACKLQKDEQKIDKLNEAYEAAKDKPRIFVAAFCWSSHIPFVRKFFQDLSGADMTTLDTFSWKRDSECARKMGPNREWSTRGWCSSNNAFIEYSKSIGNRPAGGARDLCGTENPTALASEKGVIVMKREIGQCYIESSNFMPSLAKKPQAVTYSCDQNGMVTQKLVNNDGSLTCLAGNHEKADGSKWPIPCMPSDTVPVGYKQAVSGSPSLLHCTTLACGTPILRGVSCHAPNWEGQASVNICPADTRISTYKGCTEKIKPKTCTLPASQTGYKKKNGATLSGCTHIKCDSPEIGNVECTSEYKCEKALIRNKCPISVVAKCTADDSKVTLKGCVRK